ncbi:hypothetical protein [Glacieibacterium sp.]|uniref:hypothetical protein n=1 Tax=Glacieibacterium sp. TaxID=2860237 RepID=UPI003AFF9E87
MSLKLSVLDQSQIPAWLTENPQVGTPGKVRAGIEAAAVEYGPDEVMPVNILHDHQARRHSYELVADSFATVAAAA